MPSAYKSQRRILSFKVVDILFGIPIKIFVGTLAIVQSALEKLLKIVVICQRWRRSCPPLGEQAGLESIFCLRLRISQFP